MRMAVMTIAERQRENAEKYRRHFERLGRNNPEQAKKEATSELIKMGLLNKDGSRKEKIVSWE